jgi:protein-tyrosine-phosphatase
MAVGALQVLFVCTANICRSAYAELMAAHLLADDPTVHVSSAGTHGFRDHPIDPPMAAQLRDRGVDPDRFRSRPLTMGMVEQADLVLTAESVHRQFILDDRPETFRRVFTLGQLARTLDAVADEQDLRGVRGRDLLGSLRGRYTPVEADDELADPYRQGEAAAAATATRLDDLLQVVVPRLRTGHPAAR